MIEIIQPLNSPFLRIKIPVIFDVTRRFRPMSENKYLIFSRILPQRITIFQKLSVLNAQFDTFLKTHFQ